LIAAPRWYWRALGVLAFLTIAVSLVGMNYHFVGDVIGGGVVGGLVGVYAAYFGGLAGGIPHPRERDREELE
jgi:membrane-associated phospholipid phosphatase